MKTLYLLVVVLGMAAVACGQSGSSGTYPLLTPPVKSATPAGFGGGGASSVLVAAPGERSRTLQPFTLDLSNFKSRFFSSGPSYIFGILSGVDQRIQGLNQQSSGSKAACLSQAPVQYTINPYGQTVTMFAQCYQQIGAGFTGDPGLIQWAQTSDGKFYLWVAIGAGWTAAIATPVSGTSAPYSVQVWTTVGFGQTTFDSGSYGAMQITANPVTKSFEMTAAGLGLGFCGAQLVSTDGTNIFATGSDDNGATCAATDTICVSASDGSTTAACTAAQKTFVLTPLGRQALTGTSSSFGASAYPGGTGNTIVLNGTATDSLHFGPSAPTAGVGQFQ